MKMCQAFTDNGHEVLLLAPDYKEQNEKGINDVFDFYGVRNSFKIKKIFTPKIKGRSIIYTIGILIYLSFNKADLVYGRFVNGCYLSSLLGFNTIFESHSPIWERSTLEVKLFSKLIEGKNFNKLVVISQALKNIYLKYGYLNDKRIQVAHDGADEVNDFNIKAELNGNENNLKIGYVGHLYQGKGMEVIEEIADKVPIDVDFHIIGGLIKDIDYWKSKITSKNVYFYGFVSQKEVSSYINSLDICILPNQKIVKTYNDGKKEGSNIGDFTSPLKMFEYMAHKKPIIASNLEVLKEVLNSDTSILVDSENGNEWIEAIERLKDKKIRTKMSKNSFNEFKKYTWKNRVNAIINS